MQLSHTTSQSVLVRPQVARQSKSARFIVKASGQQSQQNTAAAAAAALVVAFSGPAVANVVPQKAAPMMELAAKTGGENPVPFGNEATGSEEGATRDNMPGLGEIKGPRPKSEAFSGSNSVDVPSIPNPFAAADEAKGKAKQAISKNNPLSFINVLGDLSVAEGKPVGKEDRFGTPTGQQGEAKMLGANEVKTQGLKTPDETQKQAARQAK